MSASRYPVMVDLADRPCLVVGGGAVATRKILGLLKAEARITVRAPELSAPVAELVEAGRIRWDQGRYQALGVDDGGRPWSLVVAATDDTGLNGRVSADATAQGCWANDASDPSGGPVSIPAAWSDGPVTLAVSTDGVHPSAARWLCDQAALAVTPEVLTALEMIDELRLEDVAGGGLGRRPDWRRAVGSGTLDLIREGHLAEAKERLQACLSSSSD